MSWEDFENDCTKYLITNFGKYADFIHEGGSDSTIKLQAIVNNLLKH